MLGILFSNEKSDIKALIMIFIPFFLFLTFLLFISCLFTDSVQETLVCDASSCQYKSYNFFKKEVKNISFERDDIYQIYTRKDPYSRNYENSVEFHVYLKDRTNISFLSENTYDSLLKYNENKIQNISQKESNYKDLMTIFGIIVLCIAIIALGWVRLYHINCQQVYNKY
ncbi:hypothetical protein IJ182_08245 [bacterium]|nr:hypothetical protein [bacterium]